MLPIPPWLPPLVGDVATAGTPVLVYDLDPMRDRMRAVMAAARPLGVRVLFAVKSLPARPMVELACAELDGLDLAGPGEHALASGLAPGLVSCASPAGDAARAGATTVVSVETEAALARVLAWPGQVEVAVRVSVSALAPGHPAIGALQAGDGHRRSRFGLELDDADGQARALVLVRAATAAGRRVGLHVHGAGTVLTSPAAWGALAAAVAHAVDQLGWRPAFVDLGGGWHGVAEQLGPALAAVRVALPEVELRIEPGRLWTLGAGWAVGQVAAVCPRRDRTVLVSTLSRAAHLRWSPVALAGTAPAPGRRDHLTIVGPTCFEDDVLGDFVADGRDYPVGAPIVVGAVSGYAAAWNQGFSGVAPAAVVFRTERGISTS
ncbi:MAG: hypothetical protein KBG28_03030 [Kofleriaceae bacterium]|nr:hypothetical protein [Kofleriaceae bacterium]